MASGDPDTTIRRWLRSRRRRCPRFRGRSTGTKGGRRGRGFQSAGKLGPWSSRCDRQSASVLARTPRVQPGSPSGFGMRVDLKIIRLSEIGGAESYSRFWLSFATSPILRLLAHGLERGQRSLPCCTMIDHRERIVVSPFYLCILEHGCRSLPRCVNVSRRKAGEFRHPATYVASPGVSPTALRDGIKDAEIRRRIRPAAPTASSLHCSRGRRRQAYPRTRLRPLAMAAADP